MFGEVNHPDLQLQRFYIGRKLAIQLIYHSVADIRVINQLLSKLQEI